MPMIGGTKPSILINAKEPTNSSWGWTEYGTPLTYNASGITGNGNGVLKSNWNDSVLRTDGTSGHVSIYCNKLTTIQQSLNGMINTSGAGYSFFGSSYYSNWYGGVFTNNSNQGNAPALQTGLWLANRTGSTNSQMWINDVATNSTNLDLGKDKRNDPQAIFTLVWRNNGYPNDLYNGEIGNPSYCFVTYGLGLTSQEKTDIYNIITTFNTTLSRA